MRGRAIALVGVAIAGFVAWAVPAEADHHLIQIREVYPGTNAEEDVEFIELQMYAGGQGHLGPARVEIFDTDGNLTVTFDNLLEQASFENNQRSFLLGNDPFEVVSDYGYTTDSMDSAGGAVCFESTTFGVIDCVAWGTITSPPGSAGTPAAAIPDGSSLDRSIARGCSTLLDKADDSDDTAADFGFNAGPTPRNNSTPPTEEACPNTRFTKTPKKKTTKRKATFEFTSSPVSNDFRCKLDDAPFKDCDSPFSKRVRRGKHTFKVKAANESGSPASYSWKVVKRH